MQLVLNGDPIDETVDNNLLRETIMTLEPEEDSFVILQQDDMTYIQAAGDATNGYIIEYQNGSLAEHYSCSNAEINVQDVINAFQSFLDKDGRWKSDLRWQQDEPASDDASMLLGRYIRPAVVAVASTAVVWWLVRVFS